MYPQWDGEQAIREMLQALREGKIIEAREHFEDLMLWLRKGGRITGQMPQDEGWTLRVLAPDMPKHELTLTVYNKEKDETRVLPLHAQQIAKLVATSVLYPPPAERK